MLYSKTDNNVSQATRLTFGVNVIFNDYFVDNLLMRVRERISKIGQCQRNYDKNLIAYFHHHHHHYHHHQSTRLTWCTRIALQEHLTKSKVRLCDMSCECSRLLVFRTNISKVSSNQLQQSMLAWEYCLTTVRKPSETSRCVSAAWLLLLLWQPRQRENLLDGLMIYHVI